jgi:(1->4)-alpha-D-glucan 1-alpha-D-glucosylmutase
LFLEGAYLPLEIDLAIPAGAIAFARVRGGDAAIFAAPRLCATLSGDPEFLPVGNACWKRSRILLPPALGGRTFQHLLTGAEVEARRGDGESWIELADALETLPVGILVARR